MLSLKCLKKLKKPSGKHPLYWTLSKTKISPALEWTKNGKNKHTKQNEGPISCPNVSDTVWCRNAQCNKVTIGSNTVCCTGLLHRIGCSFVHVLPHRLRRKLLVESQLDPLNVVAKLDGWSQLQVHTLLHSGEVQQQQRLSVNLLREISCTQAQQGQELVLVFFFDKVATT